MVFVLLWFVFMLMVVIISVLFFGFLFRRARSWYPTFISKGAARETT